MSDDFVISAGQTTLTGPAYLFSDTVYSGSTSKASITGEIKLKLTWKPSFVGEKAKAWASVFIDSQVFSHASGSFVNPSGAAVSCSGDPEEVWSGSGLKQWSSQGRLVAYIDNPSQKTVLDFGPYSFSGSAAAPAQGQSGSTSCYISYYASFGLDSRGVRLTRPGAINETYDESTNTTTGDTTYSYIEKSLFGDGDAGGIRTSERWNRQTFNASHSGVWGTWDVRFHAGNYVWAPSAADDDAWTHSQEMPMGSPILDNGAWTGSATGAGQTAVTYTYTDPNDDAVARGKYILNLHDEVERDSALEYPVTVSGPSWGSDPNNAGDTLWVLHGQAAQGSREFTRGRASSTGISGSLGSEVDIPFGKIKIPLGFNIEYTSEHSSEVSGTAISPAVEAGSYIYPIFTDTYNRKVVTFRHYTPAGEHILPMNGSLIDGHPLHKIVRDHYVGSDLSWSAPQPSTVPIPAFNPDAPPPATPQD